MPEFTYAGKLPRNYPDQRDASGQILGAIERGDKREFGSDDAEKPQDAPAWWPAPDEHWLPAGEQTGTAWPGVSAGMYRAQPDAGDEDKGGSDEKDQDGPPPEPPLTPPATPPALTPPATPAADGQKDEA
jgi:hypothetical protein